MKANKQTQSKLGLAILLLTVVTVNLKADDYTFGLWNCNYDPDSKPIYNYLYYKLTNEDGSVAGGGSSRIEGQSGIVQTSVWPSRDAGTGDYFWSETEFSRYGEIRWFNGGDNSSAPSSGNMLFVWTDGDGNYYTSTTGCGEDLAKSTAKNTKDNKANSQYAIGDKTDAKKPKDIVKK